MNSHSPSLKSSLSSWNSTSRPVLVAPLVLVKHEYGVAGAHESVGAADVCEHVIGITSLSCMVDDHEGDGVVVSELFENSQI